MIALFTPSDRSVCTCTALSRLFHPLSVGPRPGTRRLLLLALLVLAGSVQAGNEFTRGGWDEIPEEEFLAEAPKVDPDAPAEFLYRSLNVDDGGRRKTYFNYHYRLKVFTEAGVEELDKIDIPYSTGWRVSHLHARIIYPDRTLVRLEGEDFYRRELFEDGKFRGYAMSFSFPALQPGCIIEYRWQASRKYWEPSLTMPLRAKYPTWNYHLRVEPFRGLASKINFYNGPALLEKKGRDFVIKTMFLQGLAEESFLPPRKDFEPWVHMGYASELENLDPDKYWGYRGGYLEEVNDDFVRPGQGKVKQLASELFEGTRDPEEMLRRAYRHCATEIVNLSDYTDQYTEQEIEDLKENKSPSDVIKHGYGTRMDINGLFASLACRAGFDAYLAQVENRSDHSFNWHQVGHFCLSDWVVAVRIDGGWRFFDPGTRFLPFEELRPENVNARAIIADEKYYYWNWTPTDAPENNKALRVARLALDDRGDLRGEVKENFSGFGALWRRQALAFMDLAEIEAYLREEQWIRHWPGAEVRNVRIERLDDPEVPLQISYDLNIPAYAAFAGNRLLFNPAVFAAGAPRVFQEEERTIPVNFPFSAREQDDIIISLPEGFQLEHSDFEAVGLAGGILNRNADLRIDEEDGSIRFLRLLQLDKALFERRMDDGDRALRLPGPPYETIKAEFDAVHRLDNQLISIVRI